MKRILRAPREVLGRQKQAYMADVMVGAAVARVESALDFFGVEWIVI